ncbi:hypothetical protein OG462_24935 [Streptomyces sp. NBC_01077]|uniref:hypothetical protein n=1 Tax=Streptomyces sp. NBC_01077 TaxID=2903746 RepID=UPI0038683D5F|nr:hypothetical protein OG462_24935 [Streptomyces sp. NBC_01077]
MTTPAPAPASTAPNTRALRLTAAGGFLFLAVCFVATVVVVLEDAIGGDGAATGFITAGFWGLGLGALAGVAALIAPRKGLVIAQYTLAITAPLLALMD